MDINLNSLLIDSDSHAGSGCINFWTCRLVTESRQDSVGLIYSSGIWKTWICYKEVVYKYHRKHSVLKVVNPTITYRTRPASRSISSMFHLKAVSQSFQMSCSSHSTVAPSVANRICCNIFFNNKRKDTSCCI